MKVSFSTGLLSAFDSDMKMSSEEAISGQFGSDLKMSGEGAILGHCLELAKLVIEMKQNASFSVKVGVDFMFTFNNEDRKDSYNRKKSPSQMKRDEFRKEKFQKIAEKGVTENDDEILNDVKVEHELNMPGAGDNSLKEAKEKQKPVELISEIKDEPIYKKRDEGKLDKERVVEASSAQVKVTKQNEKWKQYPKNCDDCGKFLRNHGDFRKHVEGCMIAKFGQS